MSLLDALLLDPVRIDVWIAKRGDGIVGSGTQTDPYDGATLAKFDAPQFVIRNNVIRNMDGLGESPARNGGIVFSYCEDALVENNVIDLPLPNPIWFIASTNVRFFNNRNSAGKLIQGVLGTAKQDELTTLIEDAAILSFL
jgi:hypothetical protein